MKKYLLCLMFVTILGGSATLFAGSIRLKNDTTFELKAEIHGADGSYLGETTIMPHRTATWNQTQSHVDSPEMKEKRGKTPFTVIWYCMDGQDYSICENVATGALVSAKQCPGKKPCQDGPQVRPNGPERNAPLSPSRPS